MQLETLSETDRAITEDFLQQHRDSSMFLRSNLMRRGFTYSGAAYEATYVAAFEAGRMVAIAGHGWTGMMMVQAPRYAAEVAKGAAEASGRKVTGLSGPLEQVRRARTALGLDSVSASMDSAEGLYVFGLEMLRTPAPSTEAINCRPAEPRDRAELVRWRIAYDVEALGSADNEATRNRATNFLDQQLECGDVWVAETDHRLLSLSAFNASLPDIVQLGGIYTPPELRGHSYAKHAISAQLKAASECGVTRSVLFTDNPSAIRCYEALGFERTDDFGLILFDGASQVSPPR